MAWTPLLHTAADYAANAISVYNNTIRILPTEYYTLFAHAFVFPPDRGRAAGLIQRFTPLVIPLRAIEGLYRARDQD